jgi:hypothetical protein
VSSSSAALPGAALLAAVQSVNGLTTYPTFHIVSTTEYTPESLEHRTFIGDNWGSIYASEGASERFFSVVANASTASSYNASTALYYAGVQARYFTVRGIGLLSGTRQAD